MNGRGYSSLHHASGAKRKKPAAKPTVKSTPNRDTIANRKQHIVKKEVPMVRYHVNLNAHAEGSFRTKLAAVLLSASIAVAAADPGSPTGVQPYAS
jgi:hypothetical protein